MIDKFFIQTNKTILSFLSEIGKNKEVFSTFSCMEMDEMEELETEYKGKRKIMGF